MVTASTVLPTMAGLSAVGRRLGISQSLMAQYINGVKKSSKERERLIMAEIATIGKELQAIYA